MANSREKGAKGGKNGSAAAMEQAGAAAAPSKRVTRSKSARQVFATVEPNNSRSTRSAADKNPGMEKSKLTRPPPRRSTRLANAQPEYDNQQLDELHARAASKESDNNDAKPAAVETKRPSRGRAAKKKSSSSDAIAREAGSNDADEDGGRACGRPAKKAAPTTRCGAAGEKKAAGKRKRAPREDPQPNKTTRQQLKKLRSAPSESIQQKKTPKQQQQDQQAAHHNLVLTPFDPSMYTVGLSVFDTPNQGQVLCAPEYVSDILQRLYNAETHQSPQRYLHNKRDIEYIKMRGILVDWLVSIHMKFRLVPECLYLAVNIVDRYLAKVPIEKDTLQLVGMTSLFIAAKYEEIYPPEVKDFVYISDRSYTKQEVLDLELEILDLLEYNVSVPTGYPFLSRFLFITSATDTMSHAASYYMERTLLEHESLKYRPSEIAAAAVCLAINHPEIREADEIEDDPEGMPQVLLDYTGFSTARIAEVAEFVAAKVSETTKFKHGGKMPSELKRKFSYKRYKKVSVRFQSPDAIDLVVSP